MTIIELYTFYFTKSKVCYIFKNSKQGKFPYKSTKLTKNANATTDFQIKN